jgi:hypothetical protein
MRSRGRTAEHRICSGWRPSSISQGKEVNNMEYSKPEIVLVGSAVDAIQSSLDKGIVATDSTVPHEMTPSAAYEADE